MHLKNFVLSKNENKILKFFTGNSTISHSIRVAFTRTLLFLIDPKLKPNRRIPFWSFLISILFHLFGFLFDLLFLNSLSSNLFVSSAGMEIEIRISIYQDPDKIDTIYDKVRIHLHWIIFIIWNYHYHKFSRHQHKIIINFNLILSLLTIQCCFIPVNHELYLNFT